MTMLLCHTSNMTMLLCYTSNMTMLLCHTSNMTMLLCHTSNMTMLLCHTSNMTTCAPLLHSYWDNATEADPNNQTIQFNISNGAFFSIANTTLQVTVKDDHPTLVSANEMKCPATQLAVLVYFYGSSKLCVYV